MKKLILLISMLPIVAIADAGPWLKKPNPNELYTSVAVNDACPFSEAELHELVNGILIRSRIKPVSRWVENETTVNVNLACASLKSDMWVYNVYVEPRKYSTHESGYLLKTIAVDSDFGFVGRGHKNGIRSSVREALEHVVTDYLKANFDLGEDE